MANYYELLGVAHDATDADVRQAVDSLYNKWRQLVSHPSPQVAEEAGRTLRVLEEIRATLDDPSRRAAYDASLNTGGLADPDALLRQAGQITPPGRRDPSGSPTAGSAARTSGLWVCPTCETDNPAHSGYCLKCGTQLLRECPECHQPSSLVTTGICGQCGYPYDVAMQRAEIKARLISAQSRVAALNNSKSGIAKPSWGCAFWIVLLGFGLIIYGNLMNETYLYPGGVFLILLPLIVAGSAQIRRENAIRTLDSGLSQLLPEVTKLETRYEKLALGQGR